MIVEDKEANLLFHLKVTGSNSGVVTVSRMLLVRYLLKGSYSEPTEFFC
jgi:hypothetical protein